MKSASLLYFFLKKNPLALEDLDLIDYQHWNLEVLIYKSYSVFKLVLDMTSTVFHLNQATDNCFIVCHWYIWMIICILQ